MDEIWIDFAGGNKALFSRSLLPRTGSENREEILRLFVGDSDPAIGPSIASELSKGIGVMG